MRKQTTIDAVGGADAVAIVGSTLMWTMICLLAGYVGWAIRGMGESPPARGQSAADKAMVQPDAREPQGADAAFFAALAQVESGGDAAAYNAGEDAAGLYQIRPIYVRDVNRILGREAFSLDDRWDTGRAEEMVRIYLRHYATRKRLGREPTAEDMARIHNGGPDGWRKRATETYGRRFMAALRAVSPPARSSD